MSDEFYTNKQRIDGVDYRTSIWIDDSKGIILGCDFQTRYGYWENVTRGPVYINDEILDKLIEARKVRGE